MSRLAIREWRARQQDLAASSQAVYFAILKVFIGWLMDRGILSDDSAAKVKASGCHGS
jgi:hypothetical protein